MEIWDAYNENGTLAGFDLNRHQPIPDGFYHLVCSSIIKHLDGTYLLTQRAYTKSQHPGEWEIGSGGSVLKGENAEEGIMREIKEETGINEGKLTHIHHIIHKESHSLHETFLLETNYNKNAIKLQKGETIDYKWITKEELIKHYDSEKSFIGEKVRLKDYINSIR